MAVHLFPEEVVPQILSYTTKSRLPQHPLLVRLYLRIPLAHRLGLTKGLSPFVFVCQFANK
jgi:hypothetical protein